MVALGAIAPALRRLINMLTDRPQVLLHVGFHKAGSSWLEHWLSRHPQIRFVPGTFAGLRNPLDICRSAAIDCPAIRWLAMSEEHWTGGLVFPEGYLYLLLRHQGFHRRPPGIAEHRERVAAELSVLFPDAHVLIVTRGVAGTLRSVYSEVVRIGGDVPFAEFLELYAQHLTEWLDYDRTIRVYRQRFGEGRVHVVPFEMLQESEDSFMRTLEVEFGLARAEFAIGRILPSLTLDQLSSYAAFSRRFLAPVARHLRNYRAMQMYLLYSKYVVDRSWTDRMICALFKRTSRVGSLDIPSGYLDRFRRIASSLAVHPRYAPYLASYLLDEDRL